MINNEQFAKLKVGSKVKLIGDPDTIWTIRKMLSVYTMACDGGYCRNIKQKDIESLA